MSGTRQHTTKAEASGHHTRPGLRSTTKIHFDRENYTDVYPVGSFPLAVGHYGTFDMSGNVGEVIEGGIVAGGHLYQEEFFQRASTRLGYVGNPHLIGFRLAAASGIRPEPEAPQLLIEPAINLKWQSVNGQAYKVQSSTDLETWTDEDTEVGTGKVISLFKEKDTLKKYWRVVAL